MNVPLVDAEALAVSKSPDGIPGNNCFMDHVHPDIGSHQEIGRLLADRVEAMGLAKAGRGWTEAQRRRAYRNQFRRLGPAYLANGRRRVGWLENWARRERLDGEAKPKDARGHLHLGKRSLDFGDVDQAWDQFLLAVSAEPKRIEEILGYAFELFCQGRPGLAEQVLVRLHREPVAESYRPTIELAFAVTAMDAGDTEQAQVIAARYGDSLKQATTDPKLGRWVTVLPDFGGQLETLVANRSEPAGVDPAADPFVVPAATAPAPSTEEGTERPNAGDLLDRAIASNPESALLYLGRARIRFSKQAYEEALADATRCLELAPENTDALKLRALLYMIQDNCQAAANDLTTAIGLDAGAADLFRIRAAAYRRLGDEAKADADLEAADKLATGDGDSVDHEDGPM
jgi:Tfp pilus assembly protein PilF